MKLRFCAKGDLLVNEPRGGRLIPGLPIKRVGRQFVPAANGKPASNPATEAPYVCDTSDPDALKRSVRLCQRVRRGELWAFDRETAAHCGVRFTPIEFDDGEWIPVRPKKKAQSKS